MVCPSQIRPYGLPATSIAKRRRKGSSPRHPQPFPANWFDQLGLKRGLQQIPGNGKKCGDATFCANYSIDYIAIYVDTSGVPKALQMHCQA
jgi:hypothetical protein